MRVLSPFLQIPNKREFLARSFQALGVLRVLERLSRQRPCGLVVLTYHRIAVPGVRSDPFYDPVISATPEGFAEQIALLCRRHRVLHLEDLATWGSRPAVATDKPPILITFDDGYRDNLEVALPVLSRHGAPATFFVPTGILESPPLRWWDHVAYVLKRTRVRAFAVPRRPEDPAPITVRMQDPLSDRERQRAIMNIISRFLAGEIEDEPWFLERLGAQAEVAVDAPALGRSLFMNQDELSQLLRAGMSIGSHGHSHVALGSLDPKEQVRELVVSRQILETRLGVAATAVAYPYGWRGAFTAQTVELAREAGYRWGFTALEGTNEPRALFAEPLALRRLNVGSSDTPVLLRARMALHATAGRSFL